MLKVKTASETKRKFLEVLKEAEENPVLITRKGQPTVVIMNAQLYESLMETIKFFAYPEIARELEKWKKT
ncbi:MAG: type II toxin-antitoxin system Phd/YefM family antitoxin [Caldiserica bacterium]|jgi:prevent-host-death family protein|nr:type II toxin-antitoxin system Phd/YefM family antitoxin [Caldisericota bacterium]MDH7562403.1 type II toxin-antitoxin system Phd/YefM family antitoxin [Caldisericota bacterium]